MSKQMPNAKPKRNPSKVYKPKKVVRTPVEVPSSTPITIVIEEEKDFPIPAYMEEKSYSPETAPASAPLAPDGSSDPNGPPLGAPSSRKKKKSHWDASEYKQMYPVLKKHRNPVYPQVTYHLPVSFSYTQSVVDAISKYHPCTLDDLKVGWRDNEHPFCAAMRSITEAWALRNLIDECETEKCEGMYIMDVGGAARRHFSLKRDYVWSCIPAYDARDMMRAFKLPGSNHCQHEWQQCDCISGRTLASFSVHSLYYIPRKDILKCLLTQQRPVHYAVLHEYRGDRGVIMEGEMEYVKSNGKIWVKAKGNLTPYCHDDMEWLSEGHYSDRNGTLEWDYARRFGDVVVIRFVASEKRYPAPPKPPRDVDAFVDFPSVSDDSVNPGVRTQDDGARTPDYSVDDTRVFDSIVNSSIDYGASITSKSYSLFLSKVTRKGRSQQCNMEKLIKYASDKYTAQTEILAPVSKSLHETALERWRRLQLQAVEYNHLRLLVCAFVWFSLLMFRIYGIRYFTTLYVVVRSIDLNAEIFTWLLLVTITGYIAHNFDHLALKYRCKRYILPAHQANFLWSVKAMVYDYCCQLPDRETDPTKLVKIVYPDEHDLECEMKPAAKAMIYHPNYPPFYPRKCVHNSVSCVKNKLLYKLPGGKYKFGLHPVLLEVARQINGNLHPMEFDEWVSRFPGPKERKLRQQFVDNMNEPLGYDFNDSASFCKFEAYPEPKYPRPVISSGVEFNYSTGRWIIELAEQLSELLPDDFMFPLHGDSFAIGAFHDSHKHFHIYDTDFTAFDSSQRDEVLFMLAEFLILCGVPKKVVERELLDTKLIKVTNRNGMKVLMKSIRCSGRSMTLLGNSIITMNTALHLYGDNLAGLLVKGDDSVLYLREPVTNIPDYVSKYLDNGLIVKMRAVNTYELEFCSSLFVPFTEGTVLVPKFGKLMAKTFWCKDMHYTEEEIERQFASILKGLSNALSPVPWIGDLYRNPVYQRWFPYVEAHHDEYNEYSSELVTPCSDTYAYIAHRYGLGADDLEELAAELRSSFPVRLASHAAEVMIEKDWGSPNDGDHLYEHFAHVDYLHPVYYISPLFEELLRSFFPWPVTLFLGLVESWYYSDYRHLLFHLLYMVSQHCFGIWATLVVHLIVNLAGPKTNFLLLMANKKPANKQPKKKQSRKKRASSGKNNLSALARMVADPCHAQLVPGLYGDENGILGKFKTVYGTSSEFTSGFVLWAPSYAGTSSTLTGFNCLFFRATDNSVVTVNTPVFPMGGSNESGTALPVGASGFIHSSVCQDYRTLSACMRLMYTGRTSDCAGRIAFLDNIPARVLVPGLNVATLFSYATDTRRVSLESSEVTFRPRLADAVPRDQSAKCFHYQGGMPAADLDDPAKAEVPTMIGFAWSGVKTSDLVFEFIQNIEWRPDVNQGYVEAPVQQSSSQPLIPKILTFLDSAMPGWSTAAMSAAKMATRQAAVSIGDYVLGGPPQRARLTYR